MTAGRGTDLPQTAKAAQGCRVRACSAREKGRIGIPRVAGYTLHELFTSRRVAVRLPGGRSRGANGVAWNGDLALWAPRCAAGLGTSNRRRKFWRAEGRSVGWAKKHHAECSSRREWQRDVEVHGGRNCASLRATRERQGAIWERLLASAAGPGAAADYVQTDRSFSGRLRRTRVQEAGAGPGVVAGLAEDLWAM